jgi:hypothetical protein
VIQSAVVVAARALSRELTARQRRTRPDRFAVFQGSSVVPLRAGAATLSEAASSTADRSAG